MNSNQVYLEAGQILAVSSVLGETGVVVRLSNSPGLDSIESTAISAAGSTSFGPYGIPTRWRIDSDSTDLSVAIGPNTAISPTEANILDGLTKSAAQINALVGGVAGGYRVARGETALDGTNPTPVATGLTTVVAFVATLKGSVAPGVGTCVLTYTVSSGTVSVYAWKPTSLIDCTLVDSTGTETFGWIAVGT